jgi:hypothetical protein
LHRIIPEVSKTTIHEGVTDVVQRAGGRLLWLGDTEAGSNT